MNQDFLIPGIKVINQVGGGVRIHAMRARSNTGNRVTRNDDIVTVDNLDYHLRKLRRALDSIITDNDIIEIGAIKHRRIQALNHIVADLQTATPARAGGFQEIKHTTLDVPEEVIPDGDELASVTKLLITASMIERRNLVFVNDHIGHILAEKHAGTNVTVSRHLVI